MTSDPARAGERERDAGGKKWSISGGELVGRHEVRRAGKRHGE